MFKSIFFISACAVSMASIAAAAPCTIADSKTQKIETAMLLIEDNKGDGDFSIVGRFADEGWSELCVFDPAGKQVLRVMPEGRMGKLGIGGFSFESSEPTYKQMSFEALKNAWPEGQYKLLARDMNGETLHGAATFTTVLPAMPEIIAPLTTPESTDKNVPVIPLADLAVTWNPVTVSQDGRPLTIRGYQVLINKENHEDPNGFSRPSFDVHVGPNVTSLSVPKAFFDSNSLYEIEVGAIEASGNQTLGGASFFQTK